MVAMEHVEFARSLALFLMIYLLICNGNFGALATQGEQKHCYNHLRETEENVIKCFLSLSFYFKKGIL